MIIKNKVVISRRNAGFGDNLFAAAHAWYYAKMTNRTLIINWAPSRYLKDRNTNGFSYFFNTPNNILGVPLIADKKVSFLARFLIRLPITPIRLFIPSLIALTFRRLLKNKNPKLLNNIIAKRERWIKDLIQQSRDVKSKLLIFDGCYGFLLKETEPFFKELRLNSKLEKRLDSFTDKYIKNKTVIGVHIRYYDKKMPLSNHSRYWLEPEKSLETIKNKLNEVISKLVGKEYIIYLATDSKEVQDYFKTNFDKVVKYNKEFGMHANMELHDELPVETAAASLIEMFLLTKSDIMLRFPPTGSWFSHLGSIYANENFTFDDNEISHLKHRDISK